MLNSNKQANIHWSEEVSLLIYICFKCIVSQIYWALQTAHICKHAHSRCSCIPSTSQVHAFIS